MPRVLTMRDYRALAAAVEGFAVWGALHGKNGPDDHRRAVDSAREALKAVRGEAISNAALARRLRQAEGA